MRNSRTLGLLGAGLAVCLALPAVALALSGTFAGKTSQHKRIRIVISAGLVEQSASTIQWRAACTDTHGHHAPALNGGTDFGGRLKGKVFNGGRGFYQGSLGATTTVDYIPDIKFSIKGRQATGRFTLSARLYDAATTPPTLTERCHTGTIRFRAAS